jgi:hypothetical protein
MRLLLVFFLSFPALSFAGQLYVCTDGAGKKSFQEMPCSGAVTSEVREYESGSGGVAGRDWQFYETKDAMTGESFCLIRSEKSIKSLPYRSFAGLQMTVVVSNNVPILGLYSSPTFSETSERFQSDFYPMLKVGDLNPVRAVELKSNVVAFSAEDSKAVIDEIIAKGSPEIMYRAKFFPYDERYTFNVKYSGFFSAFSKLMACEGLRCSECG